MNVLIIPEDFRQDQYMLKPLITAMMKNIGKPSKIRVCQDPLLGGVTEVLKWARIEEVLMRYRNMIDLFLICVDRDGLPGRRSALDGLEARAIEYLPSGRILLAENAWQEIEVWVLAGHELPKEWSWQAIRSEPNPKELYFEALSRQRNLLHAPGRGRKTLAQEASIRFDDLAVPKSKPTGFSRGRILGTARSSPRLDNYQCCPL